MNLHLPFFNLNSAKSRAIIAGAGAASFYGWLQYTAPDTLRGLLDANSLMANPLNPMIIIPPLVAAGGVFLPRFIKMPGKIGLPKFRQKAGDAQYVESGATLLEFGKNQGKGTVAKEASKTASASPSQPAPTGAPAQPKEAPAPQSAPAPVQTAAASAPAQIDESKLSSIVENKTSRIAEEVESVKKDMSSIKDDMQSLKTDIKELSSTFESSLVELKAFQSEMVNPVNFMRKYFELLDIKNVSDPVNAMMPIEQLVNNANTSDAKQPGNIEQAVRAKTETNENHASDRIAEDHPAIRKAGAQAEEFSLEEVYDMLRQKRSEEFEDDDEYGKTRRSLETQSNISSMARTKVKKMRKKSMLGEENEEILRSSLESGLTPGKIMSIVSIVDEILASMGPDGIELILEQYRAIGLKPEEERLIYGVVKMLNESKLLTDDIIAMLYRFGQVLGINDQDAELQYTKIVANKRDRKKRMPRDLTGKGDE